MIKAVFFDIGETIIDETRIWARWAKRLGVPAHTFSAVFGAAIARGEDLADVFDYFEKDFNWVAVMQEEGNIGGFGAVDVYDDAWRCLQALQLDGIFVGLAGNQPKAAAEALRKSALPANLIATSYEWDVEKPSEAFFHRIVQEAGSEANEVLYVGDRFDNDMKPAQQAGLLTAHIQRGPWGYIQDDWRTAGWCLFMLTSLVELPGLVRAHNKREAGSAT